MENAVEQPKPNRLRAGLLAVLGVVAIGAVLYTTVLPMVNVGRPDSKKFAQQMALNLDVYVVAAEHADERINQSADTIFLKPEQIAPRERDKAACAAVELIESQRALTLRRPHLHLRNEPAEV